MKAMILAAGFGTRLWPLTIDRTKPAIPVLGRPLVGFVAEYLAANGIREVLVNLHHQPDSVRRTLGDGSRFGVELDYIEETVILGTSGALDNAKDWFGNSTFVVINGKIVTDIDLKKAIAAHQSSGCLATLILKPNPQLEHFSQVIVSDGLLQGFRPMFASDKAGAEGHELPLMFTGIQILEPRIFEFIPRGCFSHITTDVYLPAIAAGERIGVHISEGRWFELSTIKRYLQTCLELLKSTGSSCDLSVGAIIEEGARVTNSILWENVYIEAGASINEAILGAGVRISSGEQFENVAIVRKCLLQGEIRPEKALPGYVRGDNYVVPLS